MEQKKRAREAWNCVHNSDDLEIVESEPLRNMLPPGSPPSPRLQQYDEDIGGMSEKLWLPSIVRSGPLGLQLTKGTSFVNKIQMGLDQASREKGADPTITGVDRGIEETRSITETPLKASQFPASILQIGSWEWKSRYDGDLVVKFYYWRKKMAWEMLSEGLKRKIEINWADICALKVTCPESGPGSMDITMSEKPKFYRETNQQSGKITSWLITADFTDGQASIHRRHVLQCSPGILKEHIVKLLSSDRHLYSLSQENDTDQENPCLGQRHSESIVPETSRAQDLHSSSNDHQQFGETVLTSIGTNVGVKNNNGQQNDMPIFVPSSVPVCFSVITGTSSGGSQLHMDRLSCNISSFQMSVHQIELNIANDPTMNDTVDSVMISPSKRPQLNLFTTIGASSSSPFSPENVRKFINETQWTNQPINQWSPPSNVQATLAAMELEKLSHDLLSDIDIEPKDVAEEAIVMSKVESLASLLHQAHATSKPQSSQASNTAIPPYVETEVATQVLDMVPSGRSATSSSGNTGEGDNSLPPPTHM